MMDLLSVQPDIQHAGQPVHWLNRGCVAWALVQPEGFGQGQIPNLIPSYPNGTLTNMDHSSVSSGWGLTRRRGGLGELRCDGIDDYVTFGASLAWEITTDFTLACWFRINDLAVSSNLVASGTQPTYDWELYYRGANASTFPSTLSFYSDNGMDFSGTTTVTDGDWHHAAVSRLGSAVTFYLDGVAAGNQTNGTALPTRNLPLLWGTDLTPGLYFLTGATDDLRLYTRGFTNTDIAALYWASALGYPQALALPAVQALSGAWSLPPPRPQRLVRRRTL